ncbi:ras-related protein Rap-2a-like [Varroa destructor]|uniref:small monomeric GTPase n=1 Tax=Varroa destructor TaxID=109461 RepID=A0A7M7KYD4_VARDE|nr:ras-related protein Rap-2a-like [Varroa destructor]
MEFTAEVDADVSLRAHANRQAHKWRVAVTSYAAETHRYHYGVPTLKFAPDLRVRSGFGWQDIKNMREQIMRVKNSDSVPVLLVGNKVDLEHQREVTRAEGEALAQIWRCPFMEVILLVNQTYSFVVKYEVQASKTNFIDKSS